MRFTPFTSRKTTKAMMRKLMTAVMNEPYMNCASPMPALRFEKSSPADHQADQRVDEILDQAGHDGGEGGADDDADREVHHVAPSR